MLIFVYDVAPENKL